MASIFLSYAREDAGKARAMASALEKVGHQVWWDWHIRGGAEFSRAIEEALAGADCVLVLWSKSSVDSPWVRDEAAAGRDSGRLIPSSLDGTSPPLGFRQFHTIDLSGWTGRRRLPNQLVSAIAALTDEQGAVGPGTPQTAPQPLHRPPPARIIGLAVAGAAAFLALFPWRPWQTRSAPVVAVVATDPSPVSSALARDLFVRLGRLQSTNPEALDLVATDSARTGLILQVDGRGNTPGRNASLALLDGKNQTLLWSKTYEQPAGRAPADLRQQLAYAAGKVLECAEEASSVRIRDESRKTYLNGCAEGSDASLPAVVRMFETVTRAEPHFRPAWAKLLLAESSSAVLALVNTGTDVPIRQSLRRHIADARKHHGAFAELLVVEMELLAPGAFGERLKLADAALELEPRNPSALAARADELMSVGRTDDAIEDAEKAFKLDPLSVARRTQYIDMLISGGRSAAAAEALKEAERLWPGTAGLEDSKLRFHTSFGDPAKAIELYRSSGGTAPFFEARMVARMNPTAENIDRATSQARALLTRSGDIETYSRAVASLGRVEEVYHAITTLKGQLPQDSTWVYFTPELAKVRADPRFMQIAHRLGLVAYWRSSGKWPDFCFEPDLPYDCEVEATKLRGRSA